MPLQSTGRPARDWLVLHGSLVCLVFGWDHRVTGSHISSVFQAPLGFFFLLGSLVPKTTRQRTSPSEQTLAKLLFMPCLLMSLGQNKPYGQTKIPRGEK